MLLFGVVAVALLFSPTCLAENSGSDSISTDEIEVMIYDALDENNEVVKQMIDDKIELHDQHNAECLSRGMFYNTIAHDCTPCSSCKSKQELCFYLCQGIFAQERLMIDSSANWVWFTRTFIAQGCLLAFLLALGAFVLYQAKKFEDFQNNFKYKPVSGDVHDKSENESFLESVSSVVPLHVQEMS